VTGTLCIVERRNPIYNPVEIKTTTERANMGNQPKENEKRSIYEGVSASQQHSYISATYNLTQWDTHTKMQ